VLLEGFVSDHQGSEFWDHSPRHSDVLLKDSHLDDAKLMALERTVFISDVDSLIQLTGKAQANSNADFHSRYHASATYTQFLEKLASEHPDRASVVKLGKSVFGKEITGLRIGDQSKPEILIQGAQHAREWIAPGALAYLAEHVVKDHSMLGDYSLMVVPVVNPDGYDFSASHNRMWRKNIDGLPKNLEEEMLQSGHSSEELLQGQCFGTDLNRNWITADKFHKLSSNSRTSSSDCSDTYEGAAPMSEVEVQHMARYIKKKQASGPGIATFVDVHSYSQAVIPAGCNNQKMSAEAKQTHLQMTQRVATAMSGAAGHTYDTGPCAEIMYSCAGVAHDWAHFDGGVPVSIAIELRDKGNYGFIAPPYEIKPAGKEMIAAVHAVVGGHKDINNVVPETLIDF